MHYPTNENYSEETYSSDSHQTDSKVGRKPYNLLESEQIDGKI